MNKKELRSKLITIAAWSRIDLFDASYYASLILEESKKQLLYEMATERLKWLLEEEEE